LHHHRIHHFLGLADTIRFAKIHQPRAAVELGIGGLDLALLVDHEDVNTLNLLAVVASAADGDPAPANLVAAVEGIQSLEDEWGLCDGCGDESLPAGKGDGTLL
jgi:hypothetical protein